MLEDATLCKTFLVNPLYFSRVIFLKLIHNLIIVFHAFEKYRLHIECHGFLCDVNYCLGGL